MLARRYVIRGRWRYRRMFAADTVGAEEVKAEGEYGWYDNSENNSMKTCFESALEESE